MQMLRQVFKGYDVVIEIGATRSRVGEQAFELPSILGQNFAQGGAHVFRPDSAKPREVSGRE